jgi:hypothetical protein
MNPTLKRYVLSSLTTFITVGIMTLALMLEAGPIEWTAAFWFAALMTAARAGVKAAVEAVLVKPTDS